MTRYFYTDPLAAAWMAKHFGMQFEILKPKLPKDEECVEIPYCSGAFIGVRMWNDGKFMGCRPHHPDERLYLHPKSVVLLEPMAGDLGEEQGFAFKFGGLIGGWNNGNWDAPVYPDDSKNVRIIHRDGVAFMLPESEGD